MLENTIAQEKKQELAQKMFHHIQTSKHNPTADELIELGISEGNITPALAIQVYNYMISDKEDELRERGVLPHYKPRTRAIWRM